jgi:hypothetical protein
MKNSLENPFRSKTLMPKKYTQKKKKWISVPRRN